ncbi:MAG: hypothetical protein FWC75_04455 [Oscillospiraceae bacterium]|nr:hypothetical protein [Oscillospiraceae bacterium]
MTKTVKNVVMAFTLLCAIFLVIFVVELILVNREASENGNEAMIYNGQEEIPGEEEPEEPEHIDIPISGAGENGENGDDEPMVIQVPEGSSRFELPMLVDDMTLLVYADLGVFEFREGEFDWWFYYREDEMAALEIAFDFITPPGGIDGLAERFLLGYLDGEESIVVGDGYIRNSSLRGVKVAGENEGVVYEAWIHSLTGRTEDGMAVVFVIRYGTQSQRDALYSILDTLQLAHTWALEADEHDTGEEE